MVSFRTGEGSSFGVSIASSRSPAFPLGAGAFGVANPSESNHLFVNEVNIGIGIFSLTSSFSFGLVCGLAGSSSLWKISLSFVSSPNSS